MSDANVSRAPRSSRDDLARHAAGIVTETMLYPAGHANASAPASGTMVGIIVGLRAGDVVTNLSCVLNSGGSGLTLVKLGLCAIDGTLLASTADAKASFTTSGLKTIAVSSPYTVTADGGYYIVYLATNSGGAQPALMRGGSYALPVIGSGAKRHVQQTGQTDLPASATLAIGDGNWYWFAAS